MKVKANTREVKRLSGATIVVRYRQGVDPAVIPWHELETVPGNPPHDYLPDVRTIDAKLVARDDRLCFEPEGWMADE